MTESLLAVEKSKTSEVANLQGKDCTFGRFITEADGWKIVEIAASWAGTSYEKKGALSVKGVSGDCSGTTNKIYIEAGFPYPYQMTSSFVGYVSKSNRFREIDTSQNEMQPGDILFWSGHMAIYAPFPEGDKRRDTGLVKKGKSKTNNMYTAFNENSTRPYGTFNSEVFRGDRFRVYRYLKSCDSQVKK